MRLNCRVPIVMLALICLVTPSAVNAQWWNKATDGSYDIFNKNNNFGSYVDTNKIDVTPRYQTNKFELKAKVEEGGWHVAWAEDLAEKDVIQGVVAAGVSVYAENPEPFLEWVQQLVNRTINSLERNAAEIPRDLQVEIRNLAARTINGAIRGKSAKELS